jgi:hypothetical protein
VPVEQPRCGVHDMIYMLWDYEVPSVHESKGFMRGISTLQYWLWLD